MERRKIGVVVAGESFSLRWLVGWTDLIGAAATKHDLHISYGYTSNVHWTRAGAAADILKVDPPVDYVLWIDDDNPPSALAGAILLSDLEANPEIAMVAGWYTLDTAGLEASFGRSYHVIGTTDKRRLPADLPDFLNPENPDLQECDWTGFGMVLMRREALASIGADGFMPEREASPDAWEAPNFGYIGEDVGFCKRARAHKLRIFVDRRVKLEHLKLRNITA